MGLNTISTTDGPIVIERPVDGIAVMRLPRRVDVYTAPAVRQASVDLVNSGAYRIVVDLGAVESMDSTGLGVLVGMQKRAQAHAGTVVLAEVGLKVDRLLRVACMAKVFGIYTSLDEALSALRHPVAAAVTDGAPTAEEPVGQELGEEVRRGAAQLHVAARAATLCDEEGDRFVRLTPEQAHAVADAWEHTADEMDDYGAREEPLKRVDGTFTTVVKNERDGHQFDWQATLAASRACLGENAPPAEKPAP